MDILKRERQTKTIYIATFIILLAIMVLLFCFIIYKHYDDLLAQRFVATMFTDVQTPTGTQPGDTLVYEEEIKTHSHTRQTRSVYLLARTNHQVMKLYLNGELLLDSGTYEPDVNPGMEMYFVALPGNYAGKTLRVEITSPYEQYHGRLTPILVSDLDTLNYYVVETSMRSVSIMALCLFIGICTIILTLWQAVNSRRNLLYQNIFIGIFAILIGNYYICTELLVYELLSPVQMSIFSIGSYMSWQVPFCWFAYFSCYKYKRHILPIAIAHTAFVVIAYILQGFGIVDFPQILNVNNSFLTVGFLYIMIFFVLEIFQKNRYLMVITPFMVAAYCAMMSAFYTFYFTKSGVNYNVYRDTILALIICMIAYNVIRFFYKYYRRRA